MEMDREEIFWLGRHQRFTDKLLESHKPTNMEKASYWNEKYMKNMVKIQSAINKEKNKQ